VICEEKHMGSRAIVIVCRDEKAARERFGIVESEIGIVYTRTGRRFFNELEMERQFLDRVRAALTAADLWGSFNTKWVCLDCELMPWSAKAQELLRAQYAAVGAAGRASLPRAVAALEQAAGRLSNGDKAQLEAIKDEYHRRAENVDRFIAAYRQYCWPVSSLDDLKLAPFHLLATEGRVHVDKDHAWHMEELTKICRIDPELLRATPYKIVDVTNATSESEGIDWWTQLTERGGEGMVVKPLSFTLRGKRGLAQPAVKCRGRKYLRIIYGPDYTTELNLARLRNRGLAHKRALALGEFALGIESLERFVRKEPLRRVHECVFGVLALESEPVDPRL
jgi:protein phosphatase